MADHEIMELARKIRYDLTAMQAKLSELMRQAALLEAPDADSRSCPECGLGAGSLPSSTTLADHRWQSHGVDAVDGQAA